MAAIDVQALKKRSPADRLEQIRALRQVVEDELRRAEAEAKKQRDVLDALEREAVREVEALERVRVPESKEVEVAQLFRRKQEPKKLEETLEDVRVAPQQAEAQQFTDYQTRDLIRVAYSFSEGRGYERIAGLRDRLAAGEKLSGDEYQSLQNYGEMVHAFERVKKFIKDEDAQEAITRSQKAIHQIESYKGKRLKGEETEERRQEF